MQETLNVSLSAVQSYRSCQQQYYYRYVERLQRKDKARPQELGSILHKYLELYYTLVSENERPQDAHTQAQMMVSKEFATKLRLDARILNARGLDKEAHELMELLPLAGRLTDRYFNTHGESDAEEYELLLVEDEVTIDLVKGIQSRGRIDLVTRHRGTGRIHLWEHKSTHDAPSNEYRLRDLQTTLYNEKLYALEMIDDRVDAVMWNYIRTKEPTVPQELKAGGLTKRSDLDSTWEVYAKEITRLRLNPKDYEDQRKRLEGREETVFFPRHEHVILADSRTLLRDYTQTAKDIRRSRKAWSEKLRRPVRTLTVLCDYCDFRDLCNAVLFAGSDRDARGRFEVRG